MRNEISTYAIPGVSRAYTITDIKNEVAFFLKMPVELLDKKTGKREIVEARQIAMFFSRKAVKGSFAVIGDEIGGKEHATVIHACKTVQNLYDTNKKFRGKINTISRNMGIKINED